MNAELIQGIQELLEDLGKVEFELKGLIKKAQKEHDIGQEFMEARRNGLQVFNLALNLVDHMRPISKRQLKRRPCFYCGVVQAKAHRTFDHFVPLRLGGEKSIINIVPSCFSCNQLKGDAAPTSHQILKFQQMFPEKKLEQITNAPALIERVWNTHKAPRH